MPSGDKLREEWAKTDKAGRRRIRRAANRGRAVEGEDPREAALVVSLARSQRRFWRWGWALGPVIVALLTIPEGLVAMAINAGFIAVVVGLFGVYFTRRSARAEQANSAIAERRAKGKRNRRKGKRG